MKKISLKWMAALFVAIVSLSFVACGDDDEKDDNGNKGIVGTWTVSEGLSSLTFIFNSDNTGTFISKYEDPYSGTETDSESFTYSMTGTNSGVIVLKQYDSYYGKNVTNVMNFTIDGNTMILYDDDNNHIVLTKTSSTGGSSSSSITSSSSIKGTYTGVDGKDQLTLTFKSNGTGTWTAKYNDSYSGIETETGSFTYSMSGDNKGILNLKVYDSYYGDIIETWYFTIEGNVMYLYEDDWGEDLEWVLTKN